MQMLRMGFKVINDNKPFTALIKNELKYYLLDSLNKLLCFLKIRQRKSYEMSAISVCLYFNLPKENLKCYAHYVNPVIYLGRRYSL